jgi:large subunit ribosomal protein L7/L12
MKKNNYSVILTDAGANKLHTVKAVKNLLNLSLKEAKDLVEGTPSLLKSGMTMEEAASMQKVLELAGATATVKYG